MTTRALFALTCLAAMTVAACQAVPGPHRAPRHMHPVRRRGILVLRGNNTAYDLDSLAPDWDPLRNAPWAGQNIVYLPDVSGGQPGLRIAGEPASDVLMGAGGPWSYRDCRHASYDQQGAPDNPNVPVGAALDVGHGICVRTADTVTPDGAPLKTDGSHYVLLVVKARTAAALTLAVTVWR